MVEVFGIIKAAMLADATIPGLVSSRIYTDVAPDDQKPPFITLQDSGNTAVQTAGGEMIELPHITINAYVAGLDNSRLKSLWTAITLLLDTYNEQSAGLSYTLRRIFARRTLDEDRSLLWSFEYIATITDD